jgi:hypothetical protein
MEQGEHGCAAGRIVCNEVVNSNKVMGEDAEVAYVVASS